MSIKLYGYKTGELSNMKKLIIVIVMTAICLDCLTGCRSKEASLNVKQESSINSTGKIGIKNLKEIGGDLYYDVTTGIVYWWNGEVQGSYATTPSVYYAPNGLPYKYNPTNNTLEEINNGGTI